MIGFGQGMKGRRDTAGVIQRGFQLGPVFGEPVAETRFELVSADIPEAAASLLIVKIDVERPRPIPCHGLPERVRACKRLRARPERVNHALGEVVLRFEVIFVDLLEKIVQRAERHAGHVPMKVLGEHRRHGGLCHQIGRAHV